MNEASEKVYFGNDNKYERNILTNKTSVRYCHTRYNSKKSIQNHMEFIEQCVVVYILRFLELVQLLVSLWHSYTAQ